MAADPAALAVVSRVPYFQGDGKRAVEASHLSGGLQNTNYKVVTEGGEAFVVRLPATDAAEHGQDQAVIFANARAAAAAGLAPEPVAFDPGTGVIVTKYVEGTTLSVAGLKSDETKTLLPRLVAAVKRLHQCNVGFVATQASDVIGGYPIQGLAGLLPGGAVPPRAVELQRLLTGCLGAFEPVVGCHNDLTPTNCIVTPDGRTFLIDWEWAGPFDVVHDLAKLVLLCELDPAGEEEVLELYFGRGAVTPTLRCRMKLWFLHTTSREALWCHAKAQCPAEQGGAAGYDYTGEGRGFAEKFASQLAAPETAALMAELAAALAAAGR